MFHIEEHDPQLTHMTFDPISVKLFDPQNGHGNNSIVKILLFALNNDKFGSWVIDRTALFPSLLFAY